jgi:hypothetical protein
MAPRRDGIVLQLPMDTRLGSVDTTPLRAEAEQAVGVLADIDARMK